MVVLRGGVLLLLVLAAVLLSWAGWSCGPLEGGGDDDESPDCDESAMDKWRLGFPRTLDFSEYPVGALDSSFWTVEEHGATTFRIVEIADGLAVDKVLRINGGATDQDWGSARLAIRTSPDMFDFTIVLEVSPGAQFEFILGTNAESADGIEARLAVTADQRLVIYDYSTDKPTPLDCQQMPEVSPVRLNLAYHGSGEYSVGISADAHGKHTPSQGIAAEDDTAAEAASCNARGQYRRGCELTSMNFVDLPADRAGGQIDIYSIKAEQVVY